MCERNKDWLPPIHALTGDGTCSLLVHRTILRAGAARPPSLLPYLLISHFSEPVTLDSASRTLRYGVLYIHLSSTSLKDIPQSSIVSEYTVNTVNV